MPRPLRILASNGFYHVFNRSNNRRSINLADQTFDFFLYLLNYLTSAYKVNIFSYCLMKNHYHLFLQTLSPNLDKAMKFFGENYSRFINKSCNSSGPAFNTRYKSKLVTDDISLLQVLRYIHLNPLEAGIVDNFKDYTWSSISEYLSEYKRFH